MRYAEFSYIATYSDEKTFFCGLFSTLVDGHFHDHFVVGCATIARGLTKQKNWNKKHERKDKRFHKILGFKSD